jgi:hypothetical protein
MVFEVTKISAVFFRPGRAISSRPTSIEPVKLNLPFHFDCLKSHTQNSSVA